MKDYNPGIICLQETKLGGNRYNPGLNYNFYHSAIPNDRSKGGASIIIDKSLLHSQVGIDTQLQAVAIQVISQKKFTVCSLYLPPDCKFSLTDLQHLVLQLPPPFLLLGDFNSHNSLWGGTFTDRKGRIVENFVDSEQLSLFNDGSATFFNVASGRSTAIDLSICSSEIFLDYTWSVNDYLYGSDHWPIHLRSAVNIPEPSFPKWNAKEANWSEFTEGIKNIREFESFTTHIEAYNYLTDIILNSAENSIPKTGGKPRRPIVPWWDKKCTVLRRITRNCYRRYKHNATLTNKIIYKRAQAKQRNYYKTAKRNSWMNYINCINSKTPLSLIWKKIRKLSGKYSPSPSPSLKINNCLITKPEEVAEKFGKHFSDISKPNHYPPDLKPLDDTTEVQFNASDCSAEYNFKFTMRELLYALSTTEDTAPGADNITYDMLKHLPDDAKIFLLNVFNKIWELGVLPQIWKISVIIPTCKPGKDGLQPSNYRPIALTSCLCKLMEKMINHRLVWFLEKNNLLSECQFGFRKNRSTLDPLLRLSNQIQQGFAENKHTIGVFFDMEKAYDTTWRLGIIKQLSNMGIKGTMLKFLKAFLTERYIKVKIGDKASSLYKQHEGVPQGSVLSVTCFSVAINNIVKAVPANVKSSLFVDDFAIYCTNTDPQVASTFIQNSITSVSKYATENGFKFSDTKTVAVHFTRSRRNDIPTTLQMNDNILPYSDEVKFLGLWLDKKLKWSKHIDVLKDTGRKSLNILKVVSNFNWGADKRSLLRLYNAICRSKLDYGSQIYSSASKSDLQNLDTIHNMGLRICSGAFRTSPIESIYIDTDQLPLDLRRQELGLRYLSRLKSASSNPTTGVFKECNLNKFKKPRLSKPLQVRMKENTNDDGLIMQEILKVEYPIIPPWMMKEPNVCPKVVTKKNSAEEAIKAHFLEHDKCHRGSIKLYCDGSKTPNGVGIAVVLNEESHIATLPKKASIFTAELTAIVKSLEVISKINGRKFTIYSDSYSALTAIKQYNPSHPILSRIQDWLCKLRAYYKEIQFCWVPAHIGIRGNETADSEAKYASTLETIDVQYIPHDDMKWPIRTYIRQEWQNRWSSMTEKNMKYKSIKPVIEPWASTYQTNRGYETRLSRLRIGHTYITHRFILLGDNQPICDTCVTPVTVEHILRDCTKYTEERLQHNISGTIEQILNNDVNVDKVMEFLKAIHVYYEI